MGDEWQIQSMAARGRVNTYSIPLNMVLRVAVSLLMALGLFIYVSIFISPALLRKMMLAIALCNDYNEEFGQLQHHAKLSNAMDASIIAGVHDDINEPGQSRLEYMEFEDSTSELPNSRNENKEEEREVEKSPHESPGFPVNLSRDGRSINVNCCPCEPKVMDNNPYHDFKDRLKNSPKISDEQIIMREKRIGEKTRDATAKFTILVGVMTMASKIDRRNLLRVAYAVQSSPDAHISVRFVIGELEGGGGVDKTLVGMENATYGDIIVLNCSENLNEGKTFTFFSSLPDRGVQYDYVMKTDDDSYIRFENLGRSLKPLSRTDLYYGYILPCENEDPYSWYMAGMGYLISWDLVLWIKVSPIARNKSVGTEDQLVGDWFNEGGVAKHRVNEKPLFYDHPEFGGKCAHDLVPETILLHQVKTPERWAHVLGFFEADRISRALSLS